MTNYLVPVRHAGSTHQSHDSRYGVLADDLDALKVDADQPIEAEAETEAKPSSRSRKPKETPAEAPAEDSPIVTDEA